MINLIKIFIILISISSCASGEKRKSKIAKMNEKGEYVNNYLSEKKPGTGDYLSFFFNSVFLPPKKKNFSVLHINKIIYEDSRTTLTWLGHSSFFYQNQDLNILIDPHFTERASPLSFLGPKRYVPSIFNKENLPKIDVVAISHNHYDHLDIKSLKFIEDKNPSVFFLVPLGDKHYLRQYGIQNVKEFDWWESIEIKKTKVYFTPVKHWSKRTLFDRNKSLWGGWWFESKDRKFLHLGDTGYTKDFLDIKNKLGSPNIVAIPIGAYEPRKIMKNNHLNPEEAVQTFLDLEAGLGVAMHWGTFILSYEPVDDPPKKLKKFLKKYNIDGNSFKILKHGESLIFD